MFGRTNVEKFEAALLLGPAGNDRLAGEGDASCDPFYRAWLRAQRRDLARTILSSGARAPSGMVAARGWIASGEWGETVWADLDLLAFDHQMFELLSRRAAEAVAESRAFSEAAAALRLLDDCCRVHHGFEEMLMELHGHADLASHREAHRSIQAQLDQLRAVHARGDLASARQVIAALRHWTDEHAAGPDRTFERLLLEARTWK
jgi:hemerythrin-like metal-binding protein